MDGEWLISICHHILQIHVAGDVYLCLLNFQINTLLRAMPKKKSQLPAANGCLVPQRGAVLPSISVGIFFQSKLPQSGIFGACKPFLSDLTTLNA